MDAVEDKRGSLTVYIEIDPERGYDDATASRYDAACKGLAGNLVLWKLTTKIAHKSSYRVPEVARELLKIGVTGFPCLRAVMKTPHADGGVKFDQKVAIGNKEVINALITLKNKNAEAIRDRRNEIEFQRNAGYNAHDIVPDDMRSYLQKEMGDMNDGDKDGIEAPLKGNISVGSGYTGQQAKSWSDVGSAGKIPGAGENFVDASKGQRHDLEIDNLLAALKADDPDAEPDDIKILGDIVTGIHS